MWDRIADWLHELDLPQRRWLAGVGALVVVAALALGLTSLTDDRDGDDRVALETEGDDSTTSTGPEDASTSSIVSLLPDGSTSSSASTATTKKPTGKTTTSTTRRTTGGTNSTGTTKAPAGGSSTTQSTTTTTGAPTTAEVTRDAGVEDRVAALFTSHRASSGLATMARSGSLDQVAVSWARHMASQPKLGHQSGDTIKAACPTPCSGWAENVGYARSADGVWNGWLGSPDHFANINEGHGGYFGVGAYWAADGNVYVAHVFGRTG